MYGNNGTFKISGTGRTPSAMSGQPSGNMFRIKKLTLERSVPAKRGVRLDQGARRRSMVVTNEEWKSVYSSKERIPMPMGITLTKTHLPRCRQPAPTNLCGAIFNTSGG